MFKTKLSDYLNNIKKTNEISTNEILTSFCFPLEIETIPDLSQLLLNDSNNYFYWEQPEKNFSFCAIRKLHSFTTNGTSRANETQNAIDALNFTHQNNFSQFNIDSIPLFVGGMKFAPGSTSQLWNDFSDSDWFVPKYLFLTKGDSTFFVFNFIYDEDNFERIISDGLKGMDYFISSKNKKLQSKNFVVKSTNFNKDYDKEEWIRNVESALEKIKNGDIRKVVLSRKVEMEFSYKSSISTLINQLQIKYPRCYIFAFAKNDSVFFGASPEKLAKLSNGYIEADALAGSFPRGSSDVDDKILANELMISKKNRAEQRAVVESITKSFKKFSSEIIYDKHPTIRKLPNIQHLWTPIKAKLHKSQSALSILKELHPTPAICGTPYNSALLSIQETEEHDRGLYAGIIGWFDSENQGEFAVAIRSAILKGNSLHAFAGCGIVKGSNPEAEYAETKLKLRPISALFDYETVSES